MAGSSPIVNRFYGAAQRLYKRHTRYSRFSRLRHSKQALNFLTEQGQRLDSPPNTAAAVFAKLKKYTASKIKGATHISDLA